MPETCHHHVLDVARFSIGQFHFRLPPWWWLWWFGRIHRWDWRPRTLWRFRWFRLSIPLRIVEVVVCFHEVVDREVILPVVKPRAAPDDLLELDHRINGTH